MARPTSSRPGLYANIQAKRERIAHGSGERMRAAGEAGAPTAKDFREAAKTAGPAKSKTSRSSGSGKVRRSRAS